MLSRVQHEKNITSDPNHVSRVSINLSQNAEATVQICDLDLSSATASRWYKIVCMDVEVIKNQLTYQKVPSKDMKILAKNLNLTQNLHAKV